MEFGRFNTSHVLIKLLRNPDISLGLHVSIHLMFLLNGRNGKTPCGRLVSIHLMFLLNFHLVDSLDRNKGFNTSHVLIKRNKL